MPALTLNELINRGRGKKASASLIAAEPDALVISVTEREESKAVVTRTLRLAGIWRVNSRGDISFWLDKNEGHAGVLHFGSAWRLNDRAAIELSLGREKVTLDGSWDILSKNRLVYQISRGTNGTLEFRGAFQTKSIFAKKGEIRYQLGAGVSRGRRSRTIVLFGKWLVSRDLELSFELEDPRGKKRTLRFGGTARLGPDRTVRVDLTGRTGERLGAELVFTRDFPARDAQTFLRLKRGAGESRVEAGLSASW